MEGCKQMVWWSPHDHSATSSMTMKKTPVKTEGVTKIIDSTYEGVYFGESSTSLRYNAATYHVLKSIVSKFNHLQILFLYIEFSKFKLDLFVRFNSI